MLTITGTIEGDKEMSVMLGATANGVSDFSEPLNQVRGLMLHTFDMNFDARGGLLQAGGWAPRKPQYRGRGRRKGVLETYDGPFGTHTSYREIDYTSSGERIDTWPLLEKTGDMRNEFRADMSKNELVLYNAAPYFKYHQSNQARKKLPRRIMMKLDQERRDTIVKIFQQFLVKVTRRG